MWSSQKLVRLGHIYIYKVLSPKNNARRFATNWSKPYERSPGAKGHSSTGQLWKAARTGNPEVLRCHLACAELYFRRLGAGQQAPQGGATTARLGDSRFQAFSSSASWVPPKSESGGAFSTKSRSREKEKQREKELKQEGGIITVLITIVGSHSQAPTTFTQSR